MQNTIDEINMKRELQKILEIELRTRKQITP